ncbi:MAG: tetratricopeptide repeat protein [Gemmatimonadales bacterium]
MRALKGNITGGILALAVTLVGVSIARSTERRPAPVPSYPTESAIRNRDIDFYRSRVARDPRSARDFTQLAALYLQRARETADNGDIVEAETNARHSLALRTARNSGAFGVLASSLLSQHRFAEALDVTRRLLAEDTTSVAARGMLGENLFELGRYDEAGKVFGTLATYKGELGIAPRLARWAELHGKPEEARRLLRVAMAEAKRRHGMPKEQLAWFHLRLGDLAFRYGHRGEAETELEAGLVIQPGDARLLGAMARLEAARGRWREAADWGERAIARTLDPATLGLLHDAYRVLGDRQKSDEYYQAMALSVLKQPGPFHRAWSLFLLDHEKEVPRVLARVQEELESRKDIYGYDLLAWALHRSGHDREAQPAMVRALALGTRDAVLLYHAGMIERALGNNGAARRHLEAALETNPYWDPFHPAEARAVLDSLSRR